MDHGKIFGVRGGEWFCWRNVTKQILGVDFPVFKLMYKWFNSLWLHHHCVCFMESFAHELCFVHLAPFVSLWLPLREGLWAPFECPLGSLWLSWCISSLAKVLKITYDHYRWEGLQFNDNSFGPTVWQNAFSGQADLKLVSYQSVVQLTHVRRHLLVTNPGSQIGASEFLSQGLGVK